MLAVSLTAFLLIVMSVSVPFWTEGIESYEQKSEEIKPDYREDAYITEDDGELRDISSQKTSNDPSPMYSPTDDWYYKYDAAHRSDIDSRIGYSPGDNVVDPEDYDEYPIDGDTSLDEYVEEVQFYGIDNPSGDDDGYADFTETEGNRTNSLIPGEQYSIEVTVGPSPDDQYVNVFFDWYGDNNLVGSEKRYDLGVTSEGGTVSGQIDVPSDADEGYTLMRVVCQWNGYWEPGTVLGYGEAEDYTAQVGSIDWWGAIRMELPAGIVTEIAYRQGDEANSVKGYIHEDGGTEPGAIIAETAEDTSPGTYQWNEMELVDTVAIEEDHYWIVLEFNDVGEDYFPFGVYEPYVDDGGWITSIGHFSGWSQDWMSDNDYSWALEAKVEPPAEFVLNDWSIDPDPAYIDEEVTIEGEVENIGGETGSTWIDLYVDDMESYKEFVTVELGPGETEWVTFTGVPIDDWDITEPGIYDVKVEPYDWPENAWESDFEVLDPDPAYFEVSGVTADDIVEGDDLVVTATIENTGDVSDTQTVEMSSGVGNDDISVTLDGGQSTTETFTTGTSSGDAGSYTATVSSNDDSDSDTFEVLEPGYFAVYNVNANDVVEGETVEVTATIENTGDETDTQTIEMTTDPNIGTDSVSVTLDGGQSTTETFTTGTSAGDAGSYTATVSSEDDSDSDSFEVLEPGYFAVYNVDANDVVEGETVEVTATIENTGDEADTQTVEMSSGVGSDSVSVTLNPGESTSETFTTGTTTGDAGSYTATVSSNDDSDQDTFEVLEGAYFAVYNVNANDVVEGETVEVTATIENTGDETDTQTIEMTTDPNIGTDSVSVTLDGGQSTTETFTTGTSSGDAGSYTATVSSEDDSDSDSFEVLGPGYFAVYNVDANDVVEGETVEVTATIENTGDETDTQTIEMTTDPNIGTDSVSVTLDGGASTTETFTTGTSSGDAGSYTATVSSEDDSDQDTFEVLEGAYFAVYDVTANDIVEGDTLEVTATIENTGDESDTQTIEMSSGVGNDDISVTLDGGQSTNETYNTGTSSGDSGS